MILFQLNNFTSSDGLMKAHKEEYYLEYLTKKKALINLNPVEGADYKSADENDKIFD